MKARTPMSPSNSNRSNQRHHQFRRNHGKAGVVYVLTNPGLRSGWCKIGCSTRSGALRATELNNQATTGTPGIFVCSFERHTMNCGLAEERVFERLADFRRGKGGQEYFEIELPMAIKAIIIICDSIEAERRTSEQIPIEQPLNTQELIKPFFSTKIFKQKCCKCEQSFQVTLTRLNTGAACPACFAFNEVPDGWIDS